MIALYEDKYLDDVVALWREAFGDGNAYAKFFFQNISENTRTVIYIKNDRAVSMLTLIPATITRGDINAPALYIYGVATAKAYRGQGLSSELLAYTDEISRSESKPLFLVPSSQSLFDFYHKHGFITAFSIKETRFSAGKIGVNLSQDFSVSDIDKHEFFDLRNEYLKDFCHIQWDVPELQYILKENEYSGGAYKKISIDNDDYYIIYFHENGILYVNETSLPTDLTVGICKQIATSLGCVSVIVRSFTHSELNGIRKQFGMIKNCTICPSEIYLNLALDK